ncbi:hypothetical protein [Brasilonema bromeliae]|uniref:SH3b domain-containing protein n=1 Tax=Brasilonema bromeliae SPC951 TaxID=385972 RepID=A0ABX1PBU4_9CYAN|nr:hypothetical protein [Brasilonema bromeliae]NMG21247.1 hypothetical protein [Brasilonema bromeliae SPC951]
MNSQHSVLIIMLNIFAFTGVSLIASSPPTTRTCTINEKGGATPVILYLKPGAKEEEVKIKPVKVEPGHKVHPTNKPLQKAVYANETVDWINVKVDIEVEGWVRKDVVTEPCYKNTATSKV